MPVQTQMQVRRGTASSWTSTNPTLAAGELGFETDTGKFKIGTGSSTWTGLAYATGLNAITYLYNATAAQTTFSGADANGLTLAYTVGTEQVFLNGALQVRGSDYTATNGTSIVLTSGALAGDVLNVIAYGATTITDTYTQAQADAKFFQNANAFVAGKNKIINGDFSVNQRNFTSTTSLSGTYTFDRWKTEGNGSSVTYSAQTFTPGTAPVAGYEGINFLRIVTASQSSSTNYALIDQPIEDVRTFAGQTITLSFWAKAASGTPKIGTSLVQNFGSGGSGIVVTKSGDVTISTSWARYSVTATIPSISGKTIGAGSFIRNLLWVSSGSTYTSYTDIGIQNNTFDIWGVQLEAGSITTPFETATGTIQGELAACRRYLPVVTGGAGSAAVSLIGYAYGTNTALFNYYFDVPARVAPTGVTVVGTWNGYAANTSYGVTPTFSAGSVNTVQVLASSGMTITSGQGSRLETGSSGSALLFTGCEL